MAKGTNAVKVGASPGKPEAGLPDLSLEVREDISKVIGDVASVEVGPSADSSRNEDGNSTAPSIPVRKEDVNPIARDGLVLEKLLLDHKNWSGVMKWLSARGYETKHIARFTGKRYQHVRNVLTQTARKTA